VHGNLNVPQTLLAVHSCSLGSQATSSSNMTWEWG